MRVLLISHTCQSATEGQPKAEWLARIPRVELRVLVPDRWLHYGQWRRPEVLASPGYAYEVGDVSLPWVGPAQNYLHWYPTLRRTLQEFRPDVIDLWEEPWGLVSAHACWLRHRLLPGAKVVTETEQNINKRLPPPFEAFRKYVLKRADFAVARSGEALQVLRGKGYRGPGQVVSNGVDPELFRPMDREVCRRKIGVEGFTVGYIGRLVEEKGLMDLVAALPMSPPGVNALFVGAGPLQRAILWRAEELGVSARVRVLPARPLAQLPEVMNAIDVMVLPSRTTGRWKEQFGRVLIEALACGTPVIGSDSGAIPEVIGEGGLVFRERDPASLAGAIRQLAADVPMGRRMGEAGRQRVLVKYTWQQVAEQMHGIYRAAMSR